MSTFKSNEEKASERMKIIYKALEDGWSVKKSNTDSKTFEFTKNQSLENDYKGLVIFSNSINCISEDIQKHLENIKKYDHKKPERSISTPIIKKEQ